MPSPSFNVMLRTGLIAGTLDMLAAIIVYAVILDKATAVQILQGIASGIFGREAYAGGTAMAVTGLLFHYVIAMLFTIGYYLVYPYLPFLHKQAIVSGVLYGAIVWTIMNMVVLPLSAYNRPPLRLGPSLLGMLILMLAIGIPVATMAARYFSRQAEAHS
jgi:uncharacterized membrane protein YagU involved in acid resistance